MKSKVWRSWRGLVVLRSLAVLGRSRTRKTMQVLVPVLLAVSLSGVARAQYSHVLDTISSSQSTLFREMNRINASRASVAQQFGGSGPAPNPAPVRVAHTPIWATAFVPVDRGHPVVGQFLSALKVSNAQRVAVRQAIDQVWVALESGARKNNLATSMGLAAAASLLVLSGKDLDDSQTSELCAQLNDRIAASPQWMRMSPRDKQQLSDALMLTTSLIVNLAQAGRTDESSKQASVALARQMMTQLDGRPPVQ